MDGRRTVYLFLVLRMIVAALVVGAGIMIIQMSGEDFPVRPLYLLLALSVVTGATMYAALKTGAPERAILWMIALTDLALETAMVHYSGGVSGQFPMIYLLTIVAAALLLEMPGGLATAFLASLAYVLYGVGEGVGWVHPPARDLLPVPTHTIGLLDVYMHVSLFFLVGTVGGYLARRIRLKGCELESAENELKQLRIDTDYILNNMSSGILVVDADRRIITMNPAAEEILGLSRERCVMQPIHEVLSGRAPRLGEELLAALEDGRSRKRHEIEVGHGSNRSTPLGLSISLLRDADGRKRGAISVFQDLTEVQEMRERVRRADRLAAIGELSAGIAHELRNPLASISGSIEMLASELELTGENKRLMELITRESDRLDRIISDFLDFARIRHPSRRPVAIGTCIEEVLFLLRNNAAKTEGIDITLECRGRLPDLNVDDEQMRQVFFNLAVNSCEAMAGGGRLEIEVAAAGAERVRVTFRDTGPGIESVEVGRLFEPFFTTKEGGTGLGLAIANKIVVAHGGTIDYNNRACGGAEFVIELPVGPSDRVSRSETEARRAQETALTL